MFACSPCECGGAMCDDCRRDLVEDLERARRSRDNIGRDLALAVNEPELARGYRRWCERVAALEAELEASA